MRFDQVNDKWKNNLKGKLINALAIAASRNAEAAPLINTILSSDMPIEAKYLTVASMYPSAVVLEMPEIKKLAEALDVDLEDVTTEFAITIRNQTGEDIFQATPEWHKKLTQVFGLMVNIRTRLKESYTDDVKSAVHSVLEAEWGDDVEFAIMKLEKSQTLFRLDVLCNMAHAANVDINDEMAAILSILEADKRIQEAVTKPVGEGFYKKMKVITNERLAGLEGPCPELDVLSK